MLLTKPVPASDTSCAKCRSTLSEAALDPPVRAAYVSIRQHTSAYVSARQHTLWAHPDLVDELRYRLAELFVFTKESVHVGTPLLCVAYTRLAVVPVVELACMKDEYLV